MTFGLLQLARLSNMAEINKSLTLYTSYTFAVRTLYYDNRIADRERGGRKVLQSTLKGYNFLTY
jgi:hypothetical protein